MLVSPTKSDSGLTEMPSPAETGAGKAEDAVTKPSLSHGGQD